MDKITQTAEEYFATIKGQKGPISFKPELYESKIIILLSSTIEKTPLDDKWIKRYSEIAAIRVIGIVTLNSEGAVDIDAAAEPDAECWYFLDCISPAGAVFSIISDGCCWYPINRRSLKISHNRKPKPSVDLIRMNIADQELIREAVGEYIKILISWFN